LVAVKKIRLENEAEGMPSTALRVISLLWELKDNTIVELKDVVYEYPDKKLYLIFEYVEQDLKKFMESKKKTGVDPELIKHIMYQVLLGLVFCHKRRVVHRDIKPQNLLISANCSVKIADFGLARAFKYPIETMTHEVETLWYRAPEILLGQKEYALPVDIWSVGCVFAELVNQTVAFPGDSEIGQIFQIFSYFGTPTESDWPGVSKLPYYKDTFPKFRAKKPEDYFPNFKNDPDALDLFNRLIALDPKERITAIDALNHKYFDSDLKAYYVNYSKALLSP